MEKIRTTREFAQAIVRVTKDWDRDDPRWQDLIALLEFSQLKGSLQK